MIVDGGVPLDDNREHENLWFFFFFKKNKKIFFRLF